MFKYKYKKILHYNVFKNNNKQTSKQPEYSGTITLPDGSKAILSVWIGQTTKGESYLSINLTELEQQQECA